MDREKELKTTIKYIDNLLLDLNSIDCKTEKLKKYYQILSKLEVATDHWIKELYEYERNKVFNSCVTSTLEEYSNPLSPQAQTAYRTFCKKIDSMQYTFEVIGDRQYKLILPPLLSRHSSVSNTYYMKNRYIYNIVERLIVLNHDRIVRLNEATIIFTFHQKNRKGIINDNDNADASCVINLISKYFLSTDDDGVQVSLYYNAVIDDDTYTEVKIIPKINLDLLI